MSLEDLTIDQLREIATKAAQMEPAYNLVQQLGKDPEGRSMLQRWAKKKNPNLSIPEVDTEDRIMKAVAEEKEAREKLEAKIQEDAIRARVEGERKRVKEKYGLNDDDMKSVEKLMVKSDDNPEPIPYYDAAARLYIGSRTPSTPTPSSFMPPTYSMPEGKVWGKGIGNAAELNRIAMDQAYQAFNEIRGGKVAQ